jgi:superfamily II DNA/RNA helicase
MKNSSFITRCLVLLLFIQRWNVFGFYQSRSVLSRNLPISRSSELKARQTYSNQDIFAGIKFSSPVSIALRKLHIINNPSPIQEASLPIVCSGASCLLHAPTGSGKTYCYLLPILKRIYEHNNLNKPLQALLVVPTPELVNQVSITMCSIDLVSYFLV